MSNKTGEMSALDHMEELRRVLIVSIIGTFVFAVVAYFFSDEILAVLLEPLTAQDQQVYFTGITEALLVRIKLSVVVGFLAALPLILWQIWSFIVPALRKHERVYFTLFVLISFLSFIGGVLFAFLGIFRLGVNFLLQFAGPELAPMLTIDKYISFVIGFLLPFGVIFQLPLVGYFLAKLEILKYSFMAKNRRYAILAIVVISTVITPPDLFTCLFVSAPMYILYELSAIIVRTVERRIARKKNEEQFAETS